MTFKVIAFEDYGWNNLLPLVYMRATFQLRCGMLDLLSRVSHLVADRFAVAPPNSSEACGACFGYQRVSDSKLLGLWCRPTLSALIAEKTELPVNQPTEGQPTLLLNGRGLWKSLPDMIQDGESWIGTTGRQSEIACIVATPSLAARLTPEILLDRTKTRLALAGLPRRDVSDHVKLMDWPWDLVDANAAALRDDSAFKWLELGHQRGTIDPGSYLLAPESIHIGRGTRIKPCVVIDAEEGPVWIGRNVTIFPHAYIQGPAFIGDGSVLQSGTVIRGGTTIGPVSKVGGEVEGSIIQGYSNKQHDGFLGHSYLGSWINIAADCINSDLKNTYGEVRVKIGDRTINTGKTFVGMFVGDYSKAGINVSFPTGACIGFCSNIFVPVSPKFVPSFAWINGSMVERYDAEKGLQLARKVMARRQQDLTTTEERVFRQIRQLVLTMEHEAQSVLEDPNWMPTDLPTTSIH